MKTSSALVLTWTPQDGKNSLLFLCKVTGSNRLDLPKGLIDEGESPLQAVIREVKEETSIDLAPYTSSLLDQGVQSYLPAKNLHLFSLNVAEPFFDIEKLVCSSMFENKKTKKLLPEVNGWTWVPFKKSDLLSAHCSANLVQCLVVAGLLPDND